MRVVELFAGVGGFRLGLEKASSAYNTVWANQWEPGRKKQHAFDCYATRFPNGSINTNADIAFAKTDVPEHELLVGGFPCQDYSVARTGAEGIVGKKGVLWWEIRDILEAKRPPYVLLENVDRLLKSPTSQRGRDFGTILYCLDQLGYCVEWRVINAADYGFAQKRRRTFIFATLKKMEIGLQMHKVPKKKVVFECGLFANAFPILDQTELSLFEPEIKMDNFVSLLDFSERFQASFENAGFMCDGAFYTAKTKPVFNGKTAFLSEILEYDVDDKYFIADNLDKWKYLKGSKRELRHKPNGDPYYYTEGAIPFPDNLDSPARTILTSESSVNRSTHVIIDLKTGRERLLTPIECERINGFPDDWTNTGMPEKFRYFVMGNALVVGVVECLGRTLESLISGKCNVATNSA